MHLARFAALRFALPPTPLKFLPPGLSGHHSELEGKLA